MATAIDMDTVLTATPFTAFGVGSTNTPTYWTGVQGGEMPEDPANPKAGEVLHVTVEEGAYEVVVMGDAGVRQRVVGLEKYGNCTLSTYERNIFPDSPVEEGYTTWSQWKKVN